ncbi:hypothetical protein R5R35_005468 [Gryllus longicercus]|uniref:Uncharacterized protein n=1 Tax=Gryllus longicercus TaxID=2509291 RepID=A0AAN9VSY3_9ORTH
MSGINTVDHLACRKYLLQTLLLYTNNLIIRIKQNFHLVLDFIEVHRKTFADPSLCMIKNSTFHLIRCACILHCCKLPLENILYQHKPKINIITFHNRSHLACNIFFLLYIKCPKGKCCTFLSVRCLESTECIKCNHYTALALKKCIKI